MSRFVYVNGRYAPYARAGVHVEDRALQLGDGIYEVCNVIGGVMLDEEPHLDRIAKAISRRRLAPKAAPNLRAIARWRRRIRAR